MPIRIGRLPSSARSRSRPQLSPHHLSGTDARDADPCRVTAMTQAVTGRRDGDAFQARLFWWRAARLLDDASPIVKVGFETGPKSFDDIWVEYDPARSPPDQTGR